MLEVLNPATEEVVESLEPATEDELVKANGHPEAMAPLVIALAKAAESFLDPAARAELDALATSLAQTIR